ncbi:TPA: PBSX family phage terminase large subunit [Enterococcus faecalis]|nr:PBSX family phage terminase large subunit [Enterococcus faecalis]
MIYQVMNMSKKLSEFLPKAFHTTWRIALNSNILHVVEKGGRGSGKSSGIAHIIVQLIMRYPVNAVAIRYVDNTIELSIFEQIKWAIEEQGVSKYFKVNKSPMKITYKPRGNYIVFRGAQNPERIKSLKDSRFPFAIAWIEELAEFKTEDDVKTITNSLLRGELADGLFYKFFYSYNPPKRRQSWVNKKYESSFQPENTFVHHSTYKDNPFIAQAFIEEVNATRAKNPKRAEWEYDGKAIGSGVVPFDNLRVIKGCITDEMAANFDNIRNGLDFGYATDPLAFVRWHYDKKKIAMTIDFISGTIAAKINPEIEFKSKIGINGILRKVASIVLLLFFIPLAPLVPGGAGVGLLYVLYVGYLMMEIKSIFENYQKMGVVTELFEDFIKNLKNKK